MTDKAMASRRFKLLSDEKRRSILLLLATGSATVSRIATTLEVERTLLSHNLRLLREEGLVTCRRQGKEIIYSVVDGLVVNANEKLLDLGCCRVALR